MPQELCQTCYVCVSLSQQVFNLRHLPKNVSIFVTTDERGFLAPVLTFVLTFFQMC